MSFQSDVDSIMTPASLKRQSAVHSALFQLFSGILVADVAPYAVIAINAPTKTSLLLLNQTLLAVCIATMLGFWLLRNLITYPGVKKSNYVLPAFAGSYGVMLFVHILGRLEYSRALLLCGFALSVVWFYFIRFIDARRTSVRVAVPPFGDVSKVRNAQGITWVPFDNPHSFPSSIDAVAADLRMDMPDVWERTLADLALRGVPVYHLKHLCESITGRVELEHISENNFGSLSPISVYMTLKHLVDLIAAIICLLLTGPLLFFLGVVIRFDSPGPALFRQLRIGYQGRPFSVYKLRTMTADSITGQAGRSAAMTKVGDARVTKIGRLLRKLRLDELPQLINVLKGEMSWIGPRPEAEILSKWYEAEIPFYRYRHIVRPGITGWAQVNQGHVSNVDDVRLKLHYDFYYIKNFSPWLDMLIVARTVRTMMTGFGSR